MTNESNKKQDKIQEALWSLLGAIGIVVILEILSLVF